MSVHVTPQPQHPSTRLQPGIRSRTTSSGTSSLGAAAAPGKSSRTRTSESHPITVSWVYRPGEDSVEGKIGLCYCPGKNVVRAGVSWQRSLKQDLTSLRDDHGVNVIVCLLSDAELRSLGVDRNYAKIVQEQGLELLRLPIVEMFAPESLDPAQALTKHLHALVSAGQSAVIHCRGGVGRAGMLGACMLLLLGDARSSSEAISLMRRRRCKTAVESRSQEQFVHRFAQALSPECPSRADGRSEAPAPPAVPSSTASSPLAPSQPSHSARPARAPLQLEAGGAPSTVRKVSSGPRSLGERQSRAAMHTAATSG